ncbi:MAG: hypothetical protein ACFFB5_03700, partial [Promethearchaeota archaeon]
TGNGYIYASSYGRDPTNWHGPAVYRNVSMTDFRIEIIPRCQASAWGMGRFSLAFYSGGAGSGTLLWEFRWGDAWYNDDSNGKLTLWDQERYRLWYKGESLAVGSWDDAGDNMIITRSGSIIKLYIDGTLEYSNSTQSTSNVESVIIQFCQNKNDRPICDELSLDKIKIDYTSPSSYEHTFTDDFNNLNNWSNATIAPFTIGGEMITSNGHIYGNSYGIEDELWHGPAIYRNVSMTDFRLEIIPKCQASDGELGKLSISFYSGGAGSGTLLWYFMWADQWYESPPSAGMYLFDQESHILWVKGESVAVGTWDDMGDNMTITRSNSTLELYIDGALEYTNETQSTSNVGSVVIQFCQWWYRPICDELRLDKIKIDYNNPSFFEYTFTDDFNSLNNWSNAAIAPYTVGGAMTTGNGYIYASSYGSDPTNWHGPALYRNVSMTDFRIEIIPRCQASAWGMGAVSIAFYSGFSSSGTLLWHFRWADAWYSDDSIGKMWLWDQDGYRLWSNGESLAAGSWDDIGDKMTIMRTGSTLELYINGTLEYTNTTQSTKRVESVVIQFCQNKNDQPICDELSLDKIKIDYNSDEVEDTTSQESYTSSQEIDTSSQESDLTTQTNNIKITSLPLVAILGTLVLLQRKKR